MAKVSLVIPVYNQGSAIEKNIAKLSDFAESRDIEILFVNDGSTDNTEGIILRNLTHRIHLLSFKKNRGKGFAVRKGMLRADGDFLVFTDADLPYSFYDIEQVISALRKYDIVIGSRASAMSRVNKERGTRHVLGVTFNFLSRIILGHNFMDTQAGLKGFASRIKEIFSLQKINNFSFDAELLFIAKKKGCRIKEIPLTLTEHSYHPINLQWISQIIKMFFSMFAIRLNNLLGRYPTKKEKALLLTFDTEEHFDLPVPKERASWIAREGLIKLLSFLERRNARATFFVTAEFAMQNPVLIRKMAEKNEIACHGFSHSDDYQSMNPGFALIKLSQAKKILERISGQQVLGFRAPRMKPPSKEVIERAGFIYDSSSHPTYLPPYYNLNKRIAHRNSNITEIPLTTTPGLRFPMFWTASRTLGTWYMRFCSLMCKRDDYIMLNFHPWEFLKLRNLPFLYRHNTGEKLFSILDKYLDHNKRRIITVREFLRL